MPQETNLNVNPYFDDFDKNKNFYKVLFKPGSPVQARELSTLQSILQNQIEQFGTHFFKEGSKVIPGNLTFDGNATCVQINDSFLGIPVSLYLNQLVGLRITGSTSGVTATIKKVLSKEDSERGNVTLYIKYEQSGSDFVQDVFSDGENLVANKDIVYGASVIAANEPFANTISFGASTIGSTMSIGEGVYFVRGTFAQVQNETLILDQYNNSPSARIGFDVQEDFITADEDPSLNDNASGFTNFAAPGADRLKIKISLIKKNLDDTNDQNFIEIARVNNGEMQKFVKDTQYNLINDTLAKRTFDESGDYYIKPFEVFAKESLNDQIGNKGIYTSEQKTQSGQIPSDDLMVVQISPGKAYVKGYAIDKISTNFIDVTKPRTTKTIEQEAVTYQTGDPLFVNNIFGSPSLGIGTTATISLLDRRRGNGGSEIGLARLYDFKAQSGSFVNETTLYETRIFDIKTFTNIKVGTAITSLAVSDHIEGARSGATGFVKSAGTNVTDFSLIDVKGKFLKDESIKINGVQNGRVITKVDAFEFNDVKSLKSAVGVSTFEADVLLDNGVKLTNFVSGNLRLSNTSGNTGIITAAGRNFAGIITSNNIVSYTVPGETIPRFNRITGVSTDGNEINISGITSVPGVCNGGVSDGLISGSIDVNDLILRGATFTLSANSLVTPVSRVNIESLDVTNTTIQLRKQYSDITVADSQFTSPNAGTDLFFQPFDEERYFISYDDGSIEPLKQSQVEISADKKTVTFVALSKSTGKANLFATVLKSKIKNKLKKLNDSNVLVVSGSTLSASGIGTNSLNDGLTTSSIFGTRVQDDKISLNVSDACQLLAVIESNDAGDPDLPTVTLTTYSGPSGNNADLVVGEKITGSQSSAVAIVVEKPNTTTLGVVYLNQSRFNIGERISTEKSGITALVTSTTEGDRNITDQYVLDPNIKPTYYDFSFITRKKDFEEPTNRLKVVFKNFFVTSDDTGDFYNASSYPAGTQNLISSNRQYQRSNADLIDIRPRVNTYDTSSTISPFDFRSRSFAEQSNNIPDPLVPEENLIVNYNYFLPRRDKLFLDKSGEFVYLEGVPADDPKFPQAIDDSIEVAKLSLPAFVKKAQDVKIVRTNHKRFTMSDIGRLEKRLENVEYYTRLSLLESDTANLQVVDSNGLNRFKSGFFVDNFKKHDSHQIGHPDFSASTDAKNGYLRPGHYTTCLDMVVGSRAFIGLGQTANPTLDLNHLNDIDGQNIQKTGRLLTLKYTEEEYIKQIYASRGENVNPYLIIFYHGNISLNPDSDTWTDTKRLDARIEERTDEYDAAVARLGINTQTGFSEVDWGAWETDWVSETVENTWEEESTRNLGNISQDQIPQAASNNITQQTVRVPNGLGGLNAGVVSNGRWVERGSVVEGVQLTTAQRFEDVVQTSSRSREGIQFKVTPRMTRQSMGDRVVSRDIIPFMRERNIEFFTTRMKPRTRFYVFFDNVDVTQFCTPKLLEVRMIRGAFATGETIRNESNAFRCRLAAPDHMQGPYDAPTKTLSTNPYLPDAGISSEYSTSTTLLNLDTFSLASQVQGEFQGGIGGNVGLKIFGSTSGAEAEVTDVRLISDNLGQLVGILSIPDPNIDALPRFETGTKTIRLTTSPTNSTLAGTVTGSAETNFASAGELETHQETIVSSRVPVIERVSAFEQRNINDRITRQVGPPRNVSVAGVTVNVEELPPPPPTVINNITNVTNEITNEITQITNVTNVTNVTEEITNITNVENTLGGMNRRQLRQWLDPVAQTFLVENTTGVFITSVDCFFLAKDDALPVTLQIRTTNTGLPTQEILPFSVVVRNPDEVNVSEDASAATRFTFDSPVYLNGETSYALVLISASENYQVWISRMGEIDISTANLPDDEQVIISQQPYLGSLFKSQNGATWDASQFEDLKFTINKARFNVFPGVGRFYSPQLAEGNSQIIKLPPNPIKTLSRKAIVGLGTPISNTLTAGLVPGVTISQFDNLNASATLISTAGIATINGSNDVTIINPGIGYTPSNGVLTYSDIPMVTQTGEGTGIIGDVTVNNGEIGVVTFTNGGKNYAVGDTLGIGTLGLGNGSGAVLSVGLITSTNSIVIDNIQGSFVTGIGTIGFNNGSTVIGIDGKTVGSGSTISSFEVDSTNDGLHFKVDHRAHGMHAFNNLVVISDVDSDVPSTKLTADYDFDSSADIPVVASSNFATFEGVGVGTTNYGYAILGNEIISYTGVADGSITGITTRGIDNTLKISHSSGDVIKKYEFAGVSLRRINKTHDMNSPSSTVPNSKDLDFYHIKVDMDSDGTDRSSGSLPDRFFSSTKRGGGTNAKASQNVQFETLTPNIQTVTPTGTSVAARVRTISATSIGGEESSFVDQGFQSIAISGQNHFETPRMIASKVNEDAKLSELPGNKSMTLEILFGTGSLDVSPVVDLDRVAMVLTSNRLNNPVSNFATDSRVNRTTQDPCASTYVSKMIQLENPATSLKVEFSSYRRDSADIRVLFKVLSQGATENSMEKDFELFPGFDNIDQNGDIINVSNNSGRSDDPVPPSSGLEFKDYVFTSRELPPFTAFQIKIDMVGTNQAQPQFIKELRAIALA